MKSARWCWVVATMLSGCGSTPGGNSPGLDAGTSRDAETTVDAGSVADAATADALARADAATPADAATAIDAGSAGDAGSALDAGTGPDASPSACAAAGAPGTVEARVQLGSRSYAAVLASNAAGDVAYTVANDTIGFDDSGPIYAEGVVRLDADLHVRFSYPHGRVVALDAAGNAYVAGSFSAPVDLGGGQVIQPIGAVDTFLTKLSPTGDVLFARSLALCGAGIESIAVARDGRIAVSGDALGTVVLDARGDAIRELGFAGQLAFDSAGNLIVGGSFAGTLDLGGGHVLATAGAADVDGFVAKVDSAGHAVFGLQIGDAALPVQVGGFGEVATPRTQAVAGVAIGPNDDIAIIGNYLYEMSLFGVTLTTPPSFPSGGMAGTFLAQLSASGAVVRSQQLASINASRPIGGTQLRSPYAATGVLRLPGTPIAVDAQGNIVFSANTTGNSQGPFAYPQLSKLTPAGTLIFSLGNGTGIAGYGAGVAVDGCGNVLWAEYKNEPSLNDAHTFLTKLAP